MIEIPEKVYNQMLTVLGYPFVTVAPDSAEDTKGYDLELTSKQIKEIILEPAINEYYRWFPIGLTQSQSVSTNFEIPFPNKDVFSVIDVRLNTNMFQYGPTGNALVDERFISTNNMYSRGMYGTRNDYGYSTARIARRSETQAFIDTNKAFKWHVIENQRKLVGFSNVMGTLEITWAMKSDSWDHVAFSQQGDVIKLCQGKMLEYFGRLRQQLMVSDAPAELNGESFIERGKELLDDVFTKWKAFCTPVIMRG